jgi:transcription initiation factor TFIIA large subunit
MYRLPQTDGPAGSEDDDDEEGEYGEEEVVVPRAAHPWLPLPARGKAKSEPGEYEAVDEEAINSDLDDSDTENEEDPEGATVETDIVFCTYDRVSVIPSSCLVPSMEWFG